MELLNKIQQELNVPKNQYNDFGKYNYRSAEDILEAVKPLLGEGVLILSDEVVNIGEYNYVKATATLKDGKDTVVVSAYAREATSKKGMDDSQMTGTASSYARKYALNGLFAIDDVKDADTMDNTKQQTTPVCPEHDTEMKLIPAGVSKSGKHYNAFYACTVTGCRETHKA